MENLDAHMGWLGEMIADEGELPSEKMHNLLLTLARVRASAQEKAAPFMAIIEAEQAKMEKAVVGLDMHEATIKALIEDCLERSFEQDNWKYAGEAGTAQIVRPKPRIVYDLNGLEVLRKSSDPVDRLIGHLRDEKPSKPYLKLKLKKAE